MEKNLELVKQIYTPWRVNNNNNKGMVNSKVKDHKILRNFFYYYLGFDLLTHGCEMPCSSCERYNTDVADLLWPDNNTDEMHCHLMNAADVYKTEQN